MIISRHSLPWSRSPTQEGMQGDSGGCGVPEGPGDGVLGGIAGDAGEGSCGGSEPAPPLPPPPDHAQPPPEAAHPRAAPGERIESIFGGHAISEVNRWGLRVGWGVVCGLHYNRFDAPHTTCKRQMILGSGQNAIDDDTCKRLLKAWIVEGYSISDDHADSRTQHKLVNARQLDLQSDADLEARLAEVKHGPLEPPLVVSSCSNSCTCPKIWTHFEFLYGFFRGLHGGHEGIMKTITIIFSCRCMFILRHLVTFRSHFMSLDACSHGRCFCIMFQLSCLQYIFGPRVHGCASTTKFIS